MKTLPKIALVVLCLCSLINVLRAQVPPLINYQGRVVVGTTNFDGSGQFKFALVNAAGTMAYWTNDGTHLDGTEPATAVTLPVTKGLYSVGLGDSAITNMTALPGTVFTNSDVRLRVWFDDGTHGSQLLTPDQRLGTVGYAFMADNIKDGAIISTKLATGAVGAAAIADGAVGTTQLAPGALATGQTIAGSTQLAQPNTNYAATSASLTTITLPTNPNVGDVVQVSGVGPGGWALDISNGQQLINGREALVWSARASALHWRSAASSADGTKLVAVAGGGNIYTSTDSGANWTAQPNAGTANWFSVASSADGSKLVAVAGGVSAGQIYTSTDSGTNWTPQPNAGTRIWTSVASSADGTKLVAVVEPGQIYTSTDSGVHWTSQPNAGSGNWFSVASSADGTKLVAVIIGGQVYTSTDSGANWTPRESNRSWVSVASSADGSKLVAVESGGQIYTSTDSGMSWLPRESNRNWVSVASSADGSKLVALANGGQIYTSTDFGVSWTPRESNRAWRSAGSSANGTKLIAMVDNGQIYTCAITITGIQGSNATVQYLGNGLWKAAEASQIAPGAVGSAELALNAVTSLNIAPAAVTSGQLASGLALGGTTSGTFSGNGAALTTLNASNISSGTVANNLTTGTSSNTPSTLVLRDTGGNFSAGTISAGVINLPTTTSATNGVIEMAGTPILSAGGGGANIFLGSGAGNFTLTGVQNTGTGWSALNKVTSGTDNTATGAFALFKNTTGTQNSADGSGALSNNTSGSRNTASGDFALNSNVTGADNTAGGWAALQVNTASENTAFGFGALSQNTTGSNNIGLGKFAGQNITAGSNNIDIGNDGGNGGADESNIIRIGTTQTDTFLTGIIHGNGSGLTGINASAVTGTITGTQIANGTVGSTQLASGLTLAGTTAGTFSGNGSTLTSLNAANITGGGTLPALNGSALTALNASNITTGTLPAAQLPATVALRAGGNNFTGFQTITTDDTTMRSQPATAGFASFMDFVDSTGGSGFRGIIGADGLGFSGATDQFTIATWTNSPLAFYTNQTRRMTILGNGNVGIGTATPAVALDVAGTINGTFSGNGSALTSLSAANMTSGGTLPALNGSALTSLTATNISSGTIPNNRTTGVSAPSAGNTLVLRDSNGDFSAHTITASLTGNASTATSATSATTASSAGSAANFTNPLAGDVTGAQGSTNILATVVSGKLLTGFSSTTGTVTATDTLLSAINKLYGNDALKAPLASPSFTGVINIPATTSASSGVIQMAGTPIVSAPGTLNVFLGNGAGNFTLTGTKNMGVGVLAMNQIAGGSFNTAAGEQALNFNAAGDNNTAVGWAALFNATGANNIGIGKTAGQNIVGGSNNIDIGTDGANESNTIRIGVPGTQTAAFIAGISGVTASGGAAVFVNSSGQLGTLTSSERFKSDIKPMADASEIILALKPVTFRYKEEIDAKQIPQFGLIAEEVAEVCPDLVIRDEKGEILTVRYEQVNAMLLNEFLKQHRHIANLEKEQQTQVAALRDENARLRAENAANAKRLAALEARDKDREARLTRLEIATPSARPVSRSVADNKTELIK